MALNFLEALDSQRKRSALINRPGMEKSEFDKMLRENAVRRLSNSGTPTTPAQSPFIEEVTRNVGMVPQGMELGESVMGGSGSNQPDTPNSVQTGLLSQPTANVIESSLVETMTPFSKDELGNWIIEPQNFLSMAFPPTKIGKTLQLTKNLIKNATVNPSETAQGTVSIPGITSPQSGFTTPESEAMSVEQGMSIDPNQASPLEGFIGTPNQGDSGGGGPTVLCTELYRQGKMPWYIYQGDSIYGRSMDNDTLTGYYLWAIPLANKMSESPLLTAILRPIIMSWAKEMAYRVGNRTTGNVLGKILSFVGEPICKAIGKGMKYAINYNKRIHVPS